MGVPFFSFLKQCFIRKEFSKVERVTGLHPKTIVKLFIYGQACQLLGVHACHPGE